MRYTVLHETKYLYDTNVTLSQQMLHMKPRNFALQQCEWYALTISPNPNEHIERKDYFGNHSDYVAVFSPHKTLTVSSSTAVNLQARQTLPELQGSQPWEKVKLLLNTQQALHMEAIAYLYTSTNVVCGPELAAYAAPSFQTNRPLIDAVYDLTKRVFSEFEFDDEATDVSTPLDEVLAGKRGVCQDFAHLMIGCLRSLGLACRYVSGYILTVPPKGKPRLIGADASHAWISVYCPIYGWIDFDPTNNCLVQNQHITVAWGRDFSDVSPMHGMVLGGGKQRLKVSVTVTPIV